MYRIVGTISGAVRYIVVQPTGRIDAVEDPEKRNRPYRPVTPVPGHPPAQVSDDLQQGIFASLEAAVCIAEVASVRMNLSNVQVVAAVDLD
jgi:hypothetical protein